MNVMYAGEDSFWAYVMERQAIYERREAGLSPPWTNDYVLRDYFFTNVFRTNDATTKFLVSDVINIGSQTPIEVIFRMLLFQFFNLPAMWEELVAHNAIPFCPMGNDDEANSDRDRIIEVLTAKLARGERVYTGAYSVPVGALRMNGKVPLPRGTVHMAHVKLAYELACSHLSCDVITSESFEDMYRKLLGYRGMGSFTGYQFALDLTYTDFITHTDDEFVIAGPGACDGLSRVYGHRVTGIEAQRRIRDLVEQQPVFAADGQRATLADIEHTLCEYSRYCKVTDPNVPPGFKHKRKYPRREVKQTSR